MVTTLSPNASETATNPMPTCGNAAAITALPQPAKVSQNVPIASAAYFFVFMISSLCCPKNGQGSFRQGSLRGTEGPEPSFMRSDSGLFRHNSLHRRWTLPDLSDTSAPSRLRVRPFADPLLYPNSYPIN